MLVTPGANQAFVDVLLVLTDAPQTHTSGALGQGTAAAAGVQGSGALSGQVGQRSGVVLFPPYYFDFHMALTVRTLCGYCIMLLAVSVACLNSCNTFAATA